MSWAAVIVGGAALVGGAAASRGAGRAADAQGRSSDAAIGEQQRQFDTLLSLTSNQRAIGNQALNALGGIYGYAPAPGFGNNEYGISEEPEQLVGDTWLPAGTTTKHVGKGWYEVWNGGVRIGTLRPGGENGRYMADGDPIPNLQRGGRTYERMPDGSVREVGGQAGDAAAPTDGNQLAPNYSAFFESPDYRFRLGQGLDAVQNSAAAQGGLYSGNALRAITEYGQGTAANEFGNYINRQLALAGMGQTATTQAGNAAMTTGANVGNLLVNQGNARASGIINQTNAITGGVNDLASLYGMYRGGYFGNRGGGMPPSSVPGAYGAGGGYLVNL